MKISFYITKYFTTHIGKGWTYVFNVLVCCDNEQKQYYAAILDNPKISVFESVQLVSVWEVKYLGISIPKYKEVIQRIIIAIKVDFKQELPFEVFNTVKYDGKTYEVNLER